MLGDQAATSLLARGFVSDLEHKYHLASGRYSTDGSTHAVLVFSITGCDMSSLIWVKLG